MRGRGARERADESRWRQVRMLDQQRTHYLMAQRWLRLATLGRVEPAPRLLPQRRGFRVREGRLQALLDVVLDVHPAVLLDPGHQLGKHGQALVVGDETRWAELACGGARGFGAQLVTLEQRDGVTVAAQPFGHGAADDAAPDHDDPRHIRKCRLPPHSGELALPHSWGSTAAGGDGARVGGARVLTYRTCVRYSQRCLHHSPPASPPKRPPMN